MADEPLHMVRLRLDGPGLLALGRRRRLALRDVDMGYLAHCALGELFGGLAPFSLTDDPRAPHGRGVTVLAYGLRDAAALRDHAERFADPGVFTLCDWTSLATKPMPTRWAVGGRVGFEVRVCPVVRPAKAGIHQDRPGAEVDAFLVACRRAGPEVAVDRGLVYADWFRDRLAGRGGASVLSVHMERFQRERFLRRTQGETRSAQSVERPDVTLVGEMEVTAQAAFADLLQRGIGRHRAFGFGMLLLRPARR